MISPGAHCPVLLSERRCAGRRGGSLRSPGRGGPGRGRRTLHGRGLRRDRNRREPRTGVSAWAILDDRTGARDHTWRGRKRRRGTSARCRSAPGRGGGRGRGAADLGGHRNRPAAGRKGGRSLPGERPALPVRAVGRAVQDPSGGAATGRASSRNRKPCTTSLRIRWWSGTTGIPQRATSTPPASFSRSTGSTSRS